MEVNKTVTALLVTLGVALGFLVGVLGQPEPEIVELPCDCSVEAANWAASAERWESAYNECDLTRAWLNNAYQENQFYEESLLTCREALDNAQYQWDFYEELYWGSQETIGAVEKDLAQCWLLLPTETPMVIE